MMRALEKGRSLVSPLGPFFVRYGLVLVLSMGMVVCIYLGDRFEREFTANLEQGFQQRVELGDLASSVHQLRKILESPRALDPGFVGGLVERMKEVEVKAKAQVDAGRIGEISLPTKELTVIVGMQQGFERLSASAGQVERAHSLKLAIKPPESVDGPALKRVGGLLDDYVNAAGALRNSRSASSGLTSLQQATMALGENLISATVESRRKTTAQAWRDVLFLLPAERGDLVDRLLADGRMLEDLQNQRLRALSRLEQVAAKIDSAERLLLQSRSSGGLLVVSTILTWSGVLCGLLGILSNVIQLIRLNRITDRSSHESLELLVPRSVLATEQHDNGYAKTTDNSLNPTASEEEQLMASRIANEIVRKGARGSDSEAFIDVASEAHTVVESKVQAKQIVSLESEPVESVTSGYWIASGSMAERRVALLDRQSLQLEQHVRAVMAAAETLAGRIDVVEQSLQLAAEVDSVNSVQELSGFRRRMEELQSIAMNLSLEVGNGEARESTLDELERFSDELEGMSEEAKRIVATQSEGAYDRRIRLSLDEARRMAAAADTLRERTELLLDDAQRFRRHSEALIRGIQEGAVAELPASYVRQRSIDG